MLNSRPVIPLGRRRRLAAVVIGILFLASCKKAAANGGFPPPQVGVVTVQPATVAESFEFPGQVLPYRRVEVRARVDGIITARKFEEGSIVQPGQLLYQIDKTRYDAAYRGALARYQSAKQNFERMEPLLARHAVAEQDVDNARAAMTSAQGTLDEAKKDLDDTDVRAEIPGRVGRAMLEVGARVTGPSDVLTTIDRLDPVYVTFRPPSDQLLEWQRSAASRTLLNPGSKLRITVVLPDGSLLPRDGKLDFLAPSLDAATGTREFRALFQNGDRLLMPGQFVRVRLIGFARDSALAVPQRAVLTGLGRQFVYVVGAGDTVRARDVVPGRWSGDLWIINSGLAAGDRVVVEGVQKAIPGRTVVPMALVDSGKTVGNDK
jgi:membrane fusion protein (multidrug efflux system)